MMIALACALIVAVLAYILFVRPADVPDPIPVSPLQHLEDRKAAIYENLRDLQFEYRLGKLSDDDYQRTKTALQKELAGVLAETEATAKRLGLETKRAAAPQAKPQPTSKGKTPSFECPHCRARFPKPMKFCGECGKAMA